MPKETASDTKKCVKLFDDWPVQGSPSAALMTEHLVLTIKVKFSEHDVGSEHGAAFRLHVPEQLLFCTQLMQESM